MKPAPGGRVVGIEQEVKPSSSDDPETSIWLTAWVPLFVTVTAYDTRFPGSAIWLQGRLPVQELSIAVISVARARTNHVTDTG